MLIPLLWHSTTVVQVAQALGFAATPVTLQDLAARTYAGTLSCDLTVAGDGGLNGVGRAINTWYYVYLVPKAGAPSQVVLRADTVAPPTGPTGYAAWRYLGAFKTNAVGAGEIIAFSQDGRRFVYQVRQLIVAYGAVLKNPLFSQSVAAVVPATAAAVDVGYGFGRTGGTGITYWCEWAVDGAAYVASGGGGPGTNIWWYGWINQNPWAMLYHTLTVPLPNATKQFGYRSWGSGGAGEIDVQALYCPAYTDGYVR